MHDDATSAAATCGNEPGLDVFYAVNATAALRRAEEAESLACHSAPGEPPELLASALGHLRLAVQDLRRFMDEQGAA